MLWGLVLMAGVIAGCLMTNRSTYECPDGVPPTTEKGNTAVQPVDSNPTLDSYTEGSGYKLVLPK